MMMMMTLQLLVEDEQQEGSEHEKWESEIVEVRPHSTREVWGPSQ